MNKRELVITLHYLAKALTIQNTTPGSKALDWLEVKASFEKVKRQCRLNNIDVYAELCDRGYQL